MKTNTEYGVFTLAIEKDYKKAIALALTLKEHSPSLPISVACPSSLKNKLMPYFDQVIEQDLSRKGFEQKLYLDEYSPYEKTFFFDSDILILKDIWPTINRWSGSAYAVRGYLSEAGVSSFGLDRESVLKKLKKDKFSVIDGAGHAYFEKPACHAVFEQGRKVLSEYEIYGSKKFADEDAMGIALTMLGIKPQDNQGFLGSPWCAINNSFVIDTDKGFCRYEDLLFGVVMPAIVHFPRFIYPFIYAKEISKTYRRHGVCVKGIYLQALKEVFVTKIKWPMFRGLKNIIMFYKLNK